MQTPGTAFTALQALPSGAVWAAGQAALEPVQVRVASHWPVAAWQTVLAGANVSAGQAGLVPVQKAATSQAPVAARQTVLEGRGVSGEHCPVEGLQVPGEEQGPLAVQVTLAQRLGAAQGAQLGPPQSMSVSPWFWIPSVQLAAWQMFPTQS